MDDKVMRATSGDPAPSPGSNTPPKTVEVAPWLQKAGISAWYLIGMALAVAAVIWATMRITPVFMGIFIALVLTALLNPATNWLAKHMKRGIAVFISLFSFIAIFAGLFTFVVTSVAGQWRQLGSKLNHGVDMIIDFLQSLPFNITLTSDDINNWIQTNVQRGQDYLQENWEKLATEVLSNASTVFVVFTVAFLAMFLSIFFLQSGAQMWRWFINMLPTRMRAKTNTASQAGWSAFAGYAHGTVIIAVTDGAMAWIFLQLIGIPLAPALGVLVMIGAFVPLVGAPSAMVVAMVVALAVDGVWKAVFVGIGIALIGQFEGHVLQPLIMGKQVSLSPVVVLLGVISGTLLAGLVGAVVAVPLMGVVWAVFSSLYRRDPPVKGPLPTIPSESPSPPQKKPGPFRTRLRNLSWVKKFKKWDDSHSRHVPDQD